MYVSLITNLLRQACSKSRTSKLVDTVNELISIAPPYKSLYLPFLALWYVINIPLRVMDFEIVYKSLREGRTLNS